jgi:aminoglycoside phosphotransferase (APT) family kinase protein
MSTRDDSRPVREEDSFDVEAVATWLRAHAQQNHLTYDLRGTPEVRQFPGGASNLTYLLEWDSQDLILRRPPVGAKARGAHDMGREHDIQAALAPVFPYVPTMVGLCRDESVIGSEFYVMERLEGTIPRRRLGFVASPDEIATLCERAWDVLVDLHGVDVATIPALAALNRGEGYVGRQVAGWTDRMSRARTDDLGDWSPITTWLDVHQPPDRGQCLIHNDYRFDNLVLSPDDLRVTGVLDWEMATVGDPLMDLGGALAYWVQADDDEYFGQFRRQPSHEPGMWSRWQIVEHYAARTGLDVTAEQWRFYEVFGLFRLAVIAQQIWFRYFHGQTHNEAYAVFGPAVAYLEQRCRRILEG